MKNVFIDSDVILDTATGRQSFVISSALVLSLAENGRIVGYTSSNSITNIYYILRKLSDHKKALKFLSSLLEFINIVPVTDLMIQKSITSEFSDFEDGIQYFAAISAKCEYIVTRNITDYSNSEIQVLLPTELLQHFKDNP